MDLISLDVQIIPKLKIFNQTNPCSKWFMSPWEGYFAIAWHVYSPFVKLSSIWFCLTKFAQIHSYFIFFVFIRHVIWLYQNMISLLGPIKPNLIKFDRIPQIWPYLCEFRLIGMRFGNGKTIFVQSDPLYPIWYNFT